MKLGIFWRGRKISRLLCKYETDPRYSVDPCRLFGGDPPKQIRIWLDDVRPAPDGYFLCRSVNEAKLYIMTAERCGAEISVIDCDHDLGDYAGFGGDGIKLLDWLAERGTFYPIELHTMNPVGYSNMKMMIERYWG